MTRIAYVNGRYLQHRQASVHVEDRGYQFGDGVYEVFEVRNGWLIDERRHFERLGRSLAAMAIEPPTNEASLGVIFREVVRRNRVRDGIVYLQVSRGVAPRNHAFPNPTVAPSVVVTARAIVRGIGEARAAAGVSVVTVPENRWGRVDIKTVNLLPNVLAKQAAKERGAFEAWFVDGEGRVTEGASTNAWIVTRDRTLVTRHADHSILSGVARSLIFDLAKQRGLELNERPFTVEEALNAREAFITATTTIVMPVVAVNGTKIGTGKPGKIATALRHLFHGQAEISPEWATYTPETALSGVKKGR